MAKRGKAALKLTPVTVQSLVRPAFQRVRHTSSPADDSRLAQPESRAFLSSRGRHGSRALIARRAVTGRAHALYGLPETFAASAPRAGRLAVKSWTYLSNSLVETVGDVEITGRVQSDRLLSPIG